MIVAFVSELKPSLSFCPTSKLIVILKDYVDTANEKMGPQKREHEMLLRAIKSLEYIFKFIIRSRILFAM